MATAPTICCTVWAARQRKGKNLCCLGCTYGPAVTILFFVFVFEIVTTHFYQMKVEKQGMCYENITRGCLVDNFFGETLL
jgi:hypothetical protein